MPLQISTTALFYMVKYIHRNVMPVTDPGQDFPTRAEFMAQKQYWWNRLFRLDDYMRPE